MTCNPVQPGILLFKLGNFHLFFMNKIEIIPRFIQITPADPQNVKHLPVRSCHRPQFELQQPRLNPQNDPVNCMSLKEDE